MANIIMKLVPGPLFDSQFYTGSLNTFYPLLLQRVISKSTVIKKDIGEMLANKFNNTDVAKALRGQSTTDLPAHFGLSDARAAALADGMANLIRESINIIVQRNAAIIVHIQAVEKNWEPYLNLPGAEYPSHPSNIVIPVMRWMLLDPSIDIGQAAYEIIFKGQNKKWDTRIQRASRSGRAIMVSLQQLGGAGGYVLPAIISQQAGANFIEYSLGQPGVAKEALHILLSRI